MEKLLSLFKQPSRPKSKEKEEHSLVFEFVDESSANQPYVHNGELHHYLDFLEKVTTSVFSDETFAHNENRQQSIGRTLSLLFNLPSRGKVLDVGWGANKFVVQGIAQTGGEVSLIDCYSVDSEADALSGIHPPKKVEDVDGVFSRYVGDFGQISTHDSELTREKFGSILFNGSWVAHGNNWTVMETLSGQYTLPDNNGAISYASQEYRDFIDQQLDHLLAEGKQHLSDNGVMILASSRYAFHGAGYSYLSLPEEKLQFFDVIRRVKKMGAKKITVIGVSNEGMEKVYQENVGTEDKIKSRIMQIVFKLFVGGIRGPRYELKINGRKMSYSEREAYFSDEANVNKLLEESPDVAALIQAELESANSRGKAVLERLTGGVTALMRPDSSPSQQINVQQVISELKDTFPQQIARIDAIAVEF